MADQTKCVMVVYLVGVGRQWEATGDQGDCRRAGTMVEVMDDFTVLVRERFLDITVIDFFKCTLVSQKVL